MMAQTNSLWRDLFTALLSGAAAAVVVLWLTGKWSTAFATLVGGMVGMMVYLRTSNRSRKNA